MGWEKIVDILSWVKDKLPIQNRLERLKNQISKLEEERKDLLNESATVKKAVRLHDIDDTLRELNKRLQNATNSS